MNQFEKKIKQNRTRLARTSLQTLQINLGRKCNQACRHCHVDAAPWRTEMMDESTAQRIGDWIRLHRPGIVDITGGAPEMSEFFRYFVKLSRESKCHVMDRNNLTILEEPGYESLPGFLAENKVEIIASLPCYSAENVNRQRGNGVFEKSIRALKQLNDLGYGDKLLLNLVYNPLGLNLPPSQKALEAEYKEALMRDFGIRFTRLFTITNQPIARFAEDLQRQGKLEEYMDLLLENFNPATLDGLMCRQTLSVGYQGEIFDCDFNQMLGMQIRNGKPLSLWDITPDQLQDYPIQTGNHCLACSAGHGSSCTGGTVS